jgi:hypothetical protein
MMKVQVAGEFGRHFVADEVQQLDEATFWLCTLAATSSSTSLRRFFHHLGSVPVKNP